MRRLIPILLVVMGITSTHALVISEVMSNPTGDDSGREWIELYNDSGADADLSSVSISIKGGSFSVGTLLQGGTVLPPGGYAIIASTVSGTTKFLTDYPSYAGTLLRASISLVNTGVTSIDVKVNGVIVSTLPSYTAAKEGQTLSLINGGYVAGSPTPGAENQIVDAGTSNGNTTQTSTSTEQQLTVPRMSPPSPDIIIYLPEEKTVVAGAESWFETFALTRNGNLVPNVTYTWAFGDGGQTTGSSTRYRYVYPGRYVTQVEAGNGNVNGIARMRVRVVSPDMEITQASSGKYGSFIDIKNPNAYDLDLSQWSLLIDGAGYPFPKNTILPAMGTTRFAGLAMGFASTTFSTSTIVSVRFPNLEEVTRYTSPSYSPIVIATSSPVRVSQKVIVQQPAKERVLGVATTSVQIYQKQTKDTRLVAWMKSILDFMR